MVYFSFFSGIAETKVLKSSLLSLQKKKREKEMAENSMFLISMDFFRIDTYKIPCAFCM